MRTLLLSLPLVLSIPAFAQCPFDPTVVPDDPILCPNATDELATQTYDSYQWYKDGNPIEGATAQVLPVEQFADAGSLFSVSATLNGCTEMSPQVLVDGWVFAGMTIMNGGDQPNGSGPNGEQLFCVGDTATLEIMLPYTTNITWFRNGSPIPGETTPILQVTGSGSYTCTGAPEVCPGFIANPGVEVEMIFAEPTQPVIDMVGEQLCASPEGDSYTWYRDGTLLADTTGCITIDLGQAAYTVFVDYGMDCQVISDAFVISGIGEHVRTSFSVAPNPSTTGSRIAWPVSAQPRGTWALLDMTGRTVRRGAFGSVGSVWLDTRELPAGRYFFKAVDDAAWAPVPLSVVR